MDVLVHEMSIQYQLSVGQVVDCKCKYRAVNLCKLINSARLHLYLLPTPGCTTLGAPFDALAVTDHCLDMQIDWHHHSGTQSLADEVP